LESGELPKNLFVGLDFISGTEPELQIAKDPLDNYEQAKGFFQQGLRWYTKAKEFYVLDGYTTEHIDILQDIGQLYLMLIPFEPSRSNRA
jgi:hypothetical protein